MRIVHTESSCGWGGQEIRILSEASGLISRGHDVILLCPAESRICTEAANYGVPVETVPIARKRLTGVAALRSWFAAHPADVVNTHSSTDSWLAALASKMIRRPPLLVRTRHISAPIPGNAASRWLFRNAVSHVVTTGEVLRSQVIRETGCSPNHVTSVPTGIDTERFSPASRETKLALRTELGLDDRRYLGIVATLRSWKGHLYLLDAFANAEMPSWKLLIIGDGPMRQPIEAKISALGLEERVQLVGQQDRPEKWLKAIDIFCLPSYANEGVPQALLQAMLTGLPIVTTPVGAILEAVTDDESALVVPPKDAATLAGALRRLANDPDLSSRIAIAARDKAVTRFSREAMLDKMEAVFRASLESVS